MCDYSLHNVKSRPAKVGDKLVTTQFDASSTRGFSAVGEPNVVVCLLSGTEVAFEGKVQWKPRLFRKKQTLGERVARFRQINKNQPYAHHDALEFPNGKIVFLTSLCEGQHATVLQLPAQPKMLAAAEPQARAAYVG